MTFSNFKISKPLQQALTDLGFSQPTTIQHRVFPVVMSGRDVCGIAQTGTGKTLAYLLPLLNSWKYNSDKAPGILILVPTRELVAQVVEIAKKLGAHLSIDVVGVYGGTNMATQGGQLIAGCDILVATPGRVYDLALSGAFKMKNIKKLVIDEVDEMLNLGFRTQILNILHLLPERRQNLLFSATLLPEVETLLDTYFQSPVRVEAAPAGTPVEGVVQTAYAVPNFYTKLALLKLLLTEDDTMTKVVVFAPSKKTADELYAALEPLLPGEVGVIHSNKEQNHRFLTVRQFKDGVYRILIATDIVARGIDIAEVTHIINFAIPAVPENYIHRIGRTGRADKKGLALSFVTPKEAPLREAIEALMRVKITDVLLPHHLEISTELTEEEDPKPIVKEIALKLPKREERGASFHEKSAKNSKMNKRVSRKDEMKKKYKKPIKRKGKG